MTCGLLLTIKKMINWTPLFARTVSLLYIHTRTDWHFFTLHRLHYKQKIEDDKLMLDENDAPCLSPPVGGVGWFSQGLKEADECCLCC